METIYRISSEDVSQYLGNRENEKKVFNQVRRSFSCMEELQVFVEIVERSINREKNDNEMLIHVEVNQLDSVNNCFKSIHTLPTGFTVLALATTNYLFHLQVEENWCGKFLSYDIYRKDYYSSEKYTLLNLASKALEDRTEQGPPYEYFLDYFIRLFAKFLANGEEQIVLSKNEETSIVIARTVLEDYLAEDDDVNADYPKTVNEFENQYIYDDVFEFEFYLNKSGKTYFQYEN